MVRESSKIGIQTAASPKHVRAAVKLDEVDRVLLEELAKDARIPNNALAAIAGIAPSTCLGRVRALVDSGVIRGFHADIDPAALGMDLQAMIAVRLQANARSHLSRLGDDFAKLDSVLNVYFVAGVDDYMLHVATTDSAQLRDFVVNNLSAHPAVAATETILIFEHFRPRGGTA